MPTLLTVSLATAARMAIAVCSAERGAGVNRVRVLTVSWRNLRVALAVYLTMRTKPSTSWNFSEIARKASHALGTPAAFVTACAAVLAWAVTGPLFGYSDTWQLIINTGTTVVTFLMVFLIQNTQNRDARALHLKLDELLRSVHSARNRLIDLENCTDEELAQIERQFKALKRRQERRSANGVKSQEAGANDKTEA
jgi:low affinity Fe/Cu permease